MMTRVGRCLGVAMIIAATCGSGGTCVPITAKESLDLVRGALIVMNQNAPSVSIVPYRYDYAPEFLAFEAMWPNPNGSTLIGYFAVNPWTGDVWETNGCYRISSAAMKKTQAAIWKRSN